MKRTHHSLLVIILLFLLQWGSATSSTGAPRKRSSPIRSIVVLVLENRSFDHMLGWMKLSLNPLLDGLTGSECNPNSSSSSSSPNPKNPKNPNPSFVCVSDPGHSFEDVLLQVFGSSSSSSSPPSMSGFVEQAFSISPDLSGAVMKGFNPSLLPVFQTLASHFAIFDRWFSATSHGAVAHDKLNLIRGYPQPTIFDSLVAVYFRSFPTTLFYRNLRRLQHAPQLPPLRRRLQIPRHEGPTAQPQLVNRPTGPYPNSEFEHSSIPATVKKIYNLTSDFLTKRDAWAGTFEHIFTELSSPRTDCPEVLPEVTSLRPGEAKGDGWLSEFQSELVELAAVLNGDYFLSSFGRETGKKMTVKQADAFTSKQTGYSTGRQWLCDCKYEIGSYDGGDCTSVNHMFVYCKSCNLFGGFSRIFI